MAATVKPLLDKRWQPRQDRAFHSKQQRNLVQKAKRTLRQDYREALPLIRSLADPEMRAHLLHRCATLSINNWRLPEALQLIEESIATADNPKASITQSEILFLLGRSSEALASAKRALTLDPLLSIQTLRRYFGQDVECLREDPIAEIMLAVERNGSSPVSILKAAKPLIDSGAIDEALELLVRIEDEKTTRSEACFWMGKAHQSARRFNEAISYYRRAGVGTPQRLLLESLATCMIELGRFGEAEKIFEEMKTVGLEGDWLSLKLCQRRFSDAWDLFRHREVSSLLRSHLNGYCQSIRELQRHEQALVLAEGGPGDEIAFASIYPELASKFKDIVITCEPRLHSLLSRSMPAITFHSTARIRPYYPHSFYAGSNKLKNRRLAKFLDNEALELAERMGVFCSVLDLLADLRPDESSFPRISYLTPRPDLVDEWRFRLEAYTSGPSVPRVTLSWRSLLPGINRDSQYLEPQDFAPLASVPAEYWLFQPGLRQKEREIFEAILPNVHVPEGLDMRDDFEGQAAFLSCMDFVVAPNTVAAELAGALGVRTFLFVRTEYGRWRARSDDSDLFYPNVIIVSGKPVWCKSKTILAIRDALAASGKFLPLAMRSWCPAPTMVKPAPSRAGGPKLRPT